MGLKSDMKKKVLDEEYIFLGWLATNKIALIINAVVLIIGFYLGHRLW